MQLRRFKSLSILCVVALCLTARGAAQKPIRLPDDPLDAIASMPASEHRVSGARVEVVDGDGEPMSGVSVAVLGHLGKNLEQFVERAAAKYGAAQDKRDDALMAAFGRRFVTGEHGIATVPRTWIRLLVIRGADVCTFSPLELQNGVLRVALGDDPPVHVRVAGPKGRPVRGVPVSLWAPWKHDVSGIRGRMTRTDAEGRVQLRRAFLRGRSPKELYVRVHAVTRQPVSFKIPAKSFVNGVQNPVRLKLPEYGQVRAYAVDGDRRPLPAIDSASLKVLNRPRAAGRDQRVFPFLWNELPVFADQIQEAAATFNFVEVGLRVKVSCTYRGRERTPTAESEGPRHHMDMRVITIDGVTAPTVLTFRLLGLDGKPVVSEQLGILFDSQAAGFSGTMITSDGEGRVKVVVHNEFEKLDKGRFRVIRRRAPGSRRAEFMGSKEFSFATLKKARGRLGDVRLELEDLLVAGQAIDTRGRPIAGASVQIGSVFRRSRTKTFSISMFGMAYFDCVNVTDDQGRFELRSLDSHQDPVKVFTQKSGYRTATQTVGIGTKDHRAVLVSTHTIHGQVLGMAGIENPCTVRVFNAKGVRQPWNSRVDKHGELEISGCVPGTYTISISTRMSLDPILTIPGVEVRSGHRCEDPRMMAIDLTKQFRRVPVTVIGPAQKPLVGARVAHWIVDQNGPRSSWSGRTGLQGACMVMLPRAGGHVEVSAPGFLPQRFVAVKAGVTVSLRPARRVKMQLRGLPTLPKNLSLGCSLTSLTRLAGGRLKWGSRFGYSVPNLSAEALGHLEFYVDEPGEYRLSLRPLLLQGGATGNPKVTTLRVFQTEVSFTLAKPAAGVAVQRAEIDLDVGQRKTISRAIEWAKANR